jgi:plastocyanin
MRDFPNTTCGGTQRAIPQEAIVVGKTGGLANCLVYLKDVSAGENAKPQAVLDQVDCRYVPHVVGVMVGEPLVIRSEDATPHNVHLQTSVNPPANFGFQQPRQQAVVQFAYPEIFKVTCDVHPWMSAWVGVFSSPYFAVTDGAGQFEIKNVPGGDYTIVVWQERLGQKEESIHVSDHGNVEENFAYAPSAGIASQ